MRLFFAVLITALLLAPAWAQTAPSASAPSPAPFAIPIRTIDDPEKEARERETLKAQKGATTAAYVSTFIAFAQFVLSLLTVIFLVGTYRASKEAAAAAKEQNELMHKQYLQDQRPWIKPALAHIRFSIENEKYSVQIRAINTGKSPAINVVFYTEAMLNYNGASTHRDINYFIQRCRSDYALRQRQTEFSNTIMPGSDRVHPHNGLILANPIDQNAMQVLIHCVIYTDGYGIENYVTGGYTIIANVAGSFEWNRDASKGHYGIDPGNIIQSNEWYAI